MVPGPVSVSEEVLDVAHVDYGSGDLEREYVELYDSTTKMLQKIMGTKNDVVLQTGEGMLALWGALKNCLKAGDKVLVLSTGLFGYGFAEMAEGIGCKARVINFEFDETIEDFDVIEKTIKEFQPKMITMVHCETPSGTLNPVEEVGRLKTAYGVPLLTVDSVSGIGGVPVKTDEWHVDLCLGGSQKCLSAPASMSFVSVSNKAWEIMGDVGYSGYDALLPFRYSVEIAAFPYTPYWHGTAQIHKACEILLNEGLENVFKRHETVAVYCRKRITEMGLRLFAKQDAIPSPTVTSVYVPANIGWKEFDARLREKGLVVGGNYGSLANKVFRIGHMGNQARMNLVEKAMNVIESVI